jgi:adenylate kinase family enzyme
MGVVGMPAMKKVAVFGNTGGGKSTLAKRLSVITGLPLYPIDLFQYLPDGGGQIPEDEYLKVHADILGRDQWIIDGYGSLASTSERLAVADTRSSMMARMSSLVAIVLRISAMSSAEVALPALLGDRCDSATVK